ncbi:NMDA receptor-regulated protein 1-domain-containing protein [Zopfochytrium polystomum]|nr:NMDA receptor-regulated protein 1-domain-containing protein [Zopfochytrium polystomum]
MAAGSAKGSAPAKKSPDLPSKELAMLKNVMKFLENKQYKKGMKTCDQILRKVPEHGETVSMKALFLCHLERRAESHELINKAIRLEISNPVCWHVYGLIYRAEKNYEQAVRCYAQAMRLDKDNAQIYRDHAMMQIQIRNYEAFVDANISLILVRPQVKHYWIGLAVSFQLIGNYDAALTTLQHYYDMFMTYVEPNVAYENSEVHLYRAALLGEAGKDKEALEYLAKFESKILDKKGMKELRAKLLNSSGQTKQAEAAYMSLVKLNPDCYDYINQLLKVKGLGDTNLNEEGLKKVLEVFEDLADQFSRSNAIRRIPLNYVSGEMFTRRVDNYMKPMFRKGVPSLFVSLKSLYSDPAKLAVIESLVHGYEASLKKSQTFEPIEADAESVELEPPSALLWVLYFLAQHYDFCGNQAKALTYIDEAIAHTPTLVELQMIKAKILKHVGDPQSAMECMDAARKLDLQDRFINSKCTKYMLRNDQVQQAESTISLFCRSDSLDKMGDLVEMQCVWFAYESAMSHIRTGKFGPALKRFHQIEKHYADMTDDQFDFHNYNMRKLTIRAYLDLLKLEDKLRAHPLYFTSAVQAVKLYIRLLDKPADDERERAAGGVDDLSEADRRKALRKARKAELMAPGNNANGTAAATAPSASGPGSNANNNKKKVDEDPEGLKLLDPAVLMQDCLKFVRPLVELSPERIESQVLGAAVFTRRKNYLQALKCLKKAYNIDPENPELHVVAVRFLREVTTTTTSTNATVAAVLLDETKALFSGQLDAAAFTEAYAARHLKSLPHQVAAAEAAVWIAATGGPADVPSGKTKAAFLEETRSRLARNCVLNAVLAGKGAWKGVSLATATTAYEYLSAVSKLGSAQADVAEKEKAEFAAKCREAFPLAAAFAPAR